MNIDNIEGQYILYDEILMEHLKIKYNILRISFIKCKHIMMKIGFSFL